MAAFTGSINTDETLYGLKNPTYSHADAFWSVHKTGSAK